MGLDFGRGGGNAHVEIDGDLCTHCGRCVTVCPGAPLYLDGKTVRIDQQRFFGCIGCGQCMCICPQGAVKVQGRDLSPVDIVPLPPRAERATADQLYGLCLARRSVRDFHKKEVPAEVISRILQIAATSPMGIPPSEVGVLVLPTTEKVAAFRNDLLNVARGWRWWLKPPILNLFKLFMSKDDYLGFKQFIGPVIQTYLDQQAKGEDWFFYDAPLAFFFYGSAFADPADTHIVATTAMWAAEACGLATCMLGFPGYFVQYNRGVREKYGLPDKVRGGLALIAGYPTVHYPKGVQRRFARVDYA